MAETIDEMKAFVAAYEEMKKAISDSSATDAMKATFAKMTPIAEAFKKKIMEGTGAVAALTEAASKINMTAFASQLSAVGNRVTTFLKSIDLSTESLQGLAVEIGAVYAAASGRISMSDEVKALGDVADGTTAQMSSMFGRIKSLAPGVVDAMGDIGPMIEKTFQQVDAVKKMETGLLMNAAAAGNLNAAMESVGGTMDNLSDMTIDFSRLTTEAGISNNITAGQAANYARELMKIPGALSQVLEATAGGREEMNMLDATIKVAAGTFQPFGKVMEDVTLLFENWNKTGEDSLDFVSKMADAAQSLKMPMDIMRGYVHDVGEQFKFLGDNTMGAIDVMSKVAPAFEASRLGPRAVAELVGKMTGAVAGMDMAQRAFISAQTGGPGGLQGSFQIQQQLAEGDTGGVMSKVEDTLTQMFGGPIVTLKDAAEDQRAAAQYAKQVQMLTTGPLKMAETEQQAKAILDAMAAGKIFDMEALAGGATPEEQTQAAMERGNEIQERQFNELVLINNQLEHYGVVAADIAARRIRPGAGTERREYLARRRTEATADAARRRVHEERAAQGPEGEIRDIAGGAKEALGMVGGFFKGVVGGIAEGRRGPLPREERQEEAEIRPLFGEERRAGRGEYDTREEIDRELNRQAETARTISGERVVRRDMAAGREVAEQRAHGERGDRGERGPRGRGGENTLIIQIRSDEIQSGIKRDIKVAIERDNTLKVSDGA